MTASVIVTRLCCLKRQKHAESRSQSAYETRFVFHNHYIIHQKKHDAISDDQFKSRNNTTFQKELKLMIQNA